MDAVGPIVAPTLASLSYETELLADPNFFSASNTELVAAFRRLNPNGVLRIGGNTADRAVIEGFDGPLPVLHPLHFGRDRIQPYFTISRRAIEQLRGFLDAADWKVIFGINLRADSAALAAGMRDPVADVLGPRLLAFQIGNEANNYFRSYEDFFRHWQAAKGTGTWERIAGPDTGANTDWVIRFAKDVPQSRFLSRHYYRGPAPKGSLADILQHDDAFDAECAAIAAVKAGHPDGLWLTEANSYYFGGLNGVSNAFASALWGLDFLLSAASNGVDGVCLHGGPKSAIDNSLEGYRTSKSEAANADLSAARRLAASNYSPISGDLTTGFGPTPLYHAMRCVAALAGSRLYRLDPFSSLPGVRLYAMTRSDGIRIVALNTDLARPAEISVGNLPANARVERLSLSAPSPSSFDLTGFPVNRASAWTDQSWNLPFRKTGSTERHGVALFSLPSTSAAILRVVR